MLLPHSSAVSICTFVLVKHRQTDRQTDSMVCNLSVIGSSNSRVEVSSGAVKYITPDINTFIKREFTEYFKSNRF
jgi:hypothetical protein